MSYNADSITVLKGLQAVRQRPSMYIGDVGYNGFHHLIFEIINNSVDQYLAGHCNKISIKIKRNMQVQVQDNGRGIPVDIHKDLNIPAVQVALTTLHAGGKFNNKTYKVSGGLHGVGVSVVNALSEYTNVVIYRDKKIYKQSYSKGITTSKLEESKIKNTKQKNHTGTIVIFKPDFEIFTEINQFDKQFLSKKFRQLSFLNKNLSITYEDQRFEYKETYEYNNGLTEFVKYINQYKQLMFEPIVISGSEQNVQYDVAFSYSQDSYEQRVLGYVNNIFTPDGGTHISGFKNGLTNFITSYIKDNNLLKNKDKGISIQGNDIRQSIIAIVSIRMQNPQFEGQTKSKLHNSIIDKLMSQQTNKSLIQSQTKNNTKYKLIVNKLVNSAKARQSLKKARQVLRKSNQLLAGSDISRALPGKLADCMKKSNKGTELFLVQGDSAGGSAKQGRDRNIQAILPLSGKITNVQKLRIQQVLQNQKISPLLAAIGINLSEQFSLDKLRYEKIIIMTDADVDGAHICTLILTFFYRYIPQLIQNKRLFIANSPLFIVKKGTEKQYAYSIQEKDKIVQRYGNKNITIQRFKGLGEMNPSQLWQTTMNPKTRKLTLVQMSLNDLSQFYFTTLMGQQTQIRKDIINRKLQYQTFNVEV